MRSLGLVVAAVAILFVGAASIAAKDVPRTPLDLPSGGKGSSLEEEDAPELIYYHGRDFEGDAFFWLVDTSGSMDGEAFAAAKAAVIDAIRQLSVRAEFAIDTWAGAAFPRSGDAAKATGRVKADATNWVTELGLGLGSMSDAAQRIIATAHGSKARKRVIYIVGDGAVGTAADGATLSDIRSANVERIPIHTILISKVPIADNPLTTLYRNIADQNDGVFVGVEL